MDRRGFLQGIFAAAAAPAIVRIGSLMPVRSIVIPTTADILNLTVNGNSLLTIEQITREALRLLNNNMLFVSSINRAYDETFDQTKIRVNLERR